MNRIRPLYHRSCGRDMDLAEHVLANTQLDHSDQDALQGAHTPPLHLSHLYHEAVLSFSTFSLTGVLAACASPLPSELFFPLRLFLLPLCPFALIHDVFFLYHGRLSPTHAEL